MKYLLLISTILFSLPGFAQKQAVFFVTNTGKYVSTKDSADFIRVVKPPDAGSKLYNVFDYYMDGKGKMEAKSPWVYPVWLEGICKTYYPNSNIKQVAFYKKNTVLGNLSGYNSDGKLSFVKKYSDPDSLSADKKRVPQKISIVACYDSTGKSLITNGNGHFITYNTNFKSIAEEGDVKNGQMTGEWKGYDEIYKTSFSEIYADGKLTSGTATSAPGETTYKKRLESATYKGGDKVFSTFLGQTIRYPSIDRENNIQGSVMLMFWVNANAVLNDIRVINKVSNTIDAEAMRVVKLSAGSWQPAYMYGKAVDHFFILPINFTLGNR